MSEKDAIGRVIEHCKTMAENLEPKLTKQEGKLEVLKAQGQDVEWAELGILAFRAIMAVRTDLAFSFNEFLSWVERVEKESAQNRRLLLTLLGLKPDTRNDEVIEAIDDIAPLFADYRKKKRGT